MTSSAPNDPLERALRALPREGASTDFTDRVLRGLATRGPARRPALRWSLAAAATALVLLAGLLGLSQRQREQGALATRAQQLREEHRQLQDELTALRQVVDENPSVIYLGGNESVDLVFDLAPVASRPEAGRARPAVFREPDPRRRPGKE